MVIDTVKIPKKDLPFILNKRDYKWRHFFVYTAEKHDTGEYSIRKTSNALYTCAAAVIFIPTFIYYTVIECGKKIAEIFIDLAEDFRLDTRFCSQKAKEYFNE